LFSFVSYLSSAAAARYTSSPLGTSTFAASATPGFSILSTTSSFVLGFSSLAFRFGLL